MRLPAGFRPVRLILAEQGADRRRPPGQKRAFLTVPPETLAFRVPPAMFLAGLGASSVRAGRSAGRRGGLAPASAGQHQVSALGSVVYRTAGATVHVATMCISTACSGQGAPVNTVQ